MKIKSEDITILFKEKAGDKAEEIIAEVKADPEFYINEGGSDGTFGNMMFHQTYGHLIPEIIDLAVYFLMSKKD